MIRPEVAAGIDDRPAALVPTGLGVGSVRPY